MRVTRPRLDERQQRVLLRLVEAVDLVDEQDRVPAALARLCSACSIAARMSFTPDSTADSAMNSQSKALAVRRASVVLPTPGGPHRIIECGLPGLERQAQRLARAQQVALADHLVEGLRPQRLGQRRRGFGLEKVIHGHGHAVMHRIRPVRRQRDVTVGQRRVTGDLLTDHVGALRHVELERLRASAGLRWKLVNFSTEVWPKLSLQFHRLRHAVLQADADLLEAGVLGFRRRVQPFQAVVRAGFGQREVLFQVVAAEQDRGRRAAQRVAQLAAW